jgi:hypothetical protein
LFNLLACCVLGVAAVATKLFKSVKEKAKEAMEAFFGTKVASGLINKVCTVG